VVPMKKINIRQAGPVRLTAAACSIYKVPN
jgi:hypothetical protein